MSERIFDGLKVIDCASFIAGPAAATVMSDFGAEVVKIEPPGMGDPYRRRAVPNPAAPLNPGFFFDAATRRASRSTCAPTPGRAVLHRLVKAADVFITNYPPPARGRLGIRYDDLEHLNERLIYASFTGYGETGPEANKPGFDATAWWARTGLMDLVRAGEHATPARSLPGMGDHPSAMGTYGAIVTALYQREKTGKGNYVGSSLLANGLWANACSVQAALCGDEVRPQPPRDEALQRCACITNAATGAGSCCRSPPTNGAGTSSRPASASPPSSTTSASRPTRCATSTRAELVAIFDRLFAEHDLAHWRKTLDEAGLIFGVVGRVDDIRHDEQALAAGFLKPYVDDPGFVDDRQPVLPGGPGKGAAAHRAPPSASTATRCLRQYGYGDAEIAEMRAAGVVA